jgi:hypothetical protein
MPLRVVQSLSLPSARGSVGEIDGGHETGTPDQIGEMTAAADQKSQRGVDHLIPADVRTIVEAPVAQTHEGRYDDLATYQAGDSRHVFRRGQFSQSRLRCRGYAGGDLRT